MVEMALMAPVLIMLLLIALDVGRAFSAWIALSNAAREGAYLASTRFKGDLTDQAIRDAVAGEAGEITIQANATYVAIAYPTPDVIQVTARYPFDPLAPLVDNLWGGGSTWISASASFPVPVPTPTPVP